MVQRKKWYVPQTKHTGWSKRDPAEVRRRKMLAAHKHDKLATARSLQALSNITQDDKTKELAAQDSRYFYRLHKPKKH
jgi:hypothetical protein